jgi:hypothetical protein
MLPAYGTNLAAVPVTLHGLSALGSGELSMLAFDCGNDE